ncbi:Telomerase reverse transcriptase [Lecanora helva]
MKDDCLAMILTLIDDIRIGKEYPKDFVVRHLTLSGSYKCIMRVVRIINYYFTTVLSGNAQSQNSVLQNRMDSTQLKAQVLEPQSISTQKVSILKPPSNSPRPSFFSLATPQAHVSAFARAVLANLIPEAFWGTGEEGHENKDRVMGKVDSFIRLRRFENMTLHTVCHSIKVSSMSWLSPVHLKPNAKMSMSDIRKREEMLQEFLYYIFDSFLIPLVRSNFHVTESNVHQNRLFYFRHDIWRALTEPTMMTLKTSTFEEIKTLKARKMLDARALGFSQIRLLPKAGGVRSITNLRRRVTKLQSGKVTLGRSINSIMAPVFNVLDYQKKRRPEAIGSALFSVGDMYPKLKSFATVLWEGSTTRKPLYFTKADARSCFDTIPQSRLIGLIRKIVTGCDYRIGRHAEIKASDITSYGVLGKGTAKPARKFVSSARVATDFSDFDDLVAAEFGRSKRDTVFVDGVVQTTQKRSNVLGLLEDHVERNIIKVGKKFYRQKAGIPQGSVLSSLLCNFFYAELEREHLGFLEKNESLLLRLIDDFLLITTNKDHARRFLQIMHNGIEQYGVEVNPDKSLANFRCVINGRQIPQSSDPTRFPYCGNVIDTRNLEISKDRDRRKMTGKLAPDQEQIYG